MSSRRRAAANSQGDGTGYKRREYEELHPKDQQIKQTKKLCIEKNWNTPIEHCLPANIVPRIEVKKGAKARIGDPEREPEVWWNWSVELLKAIEELSMMTEGDVGYAKRLLTCEVEGRQDDPKSSQRKVLEVLLGDVQKVVDEQRKRLAAGYHQDVMTDAGHGAQYDRGQYYSSLAERMPEGPSRKRLRQTTTEDGYDGPNIDPALNDTAYAAMQHRTDHANGSAVIPRSRPADTMANNADEAHTFESHDSATPTADFTANTSASSSSDLSKLIEATQAKAEAAKLRMKAATMEFEAGKMEVAYHEKKVKEMRDAAGRGMA
ncbi:hypothetical protein KVT40_007226 [Elsinoe batatas]|uniref:Uncharacterized protein n=1 Tax=Elsinoe batatas TaxID=2601811 RepID=A0A8K0KY94_9PEZI|nr:hypothetical protein KVT40_007226 [Elsinoe batatas]